MIKFKQIDDEHIDVMIGEKVVGQIFTPSGTSHDNIDCIQVCGFDRAFDLWGCGIFYNPENNKSRQDIQLKFSKDSIKRNNTYDLKTDCSVCYNKPCTCDELKIHKERELTIEKTRIY